ncbi:MAG: ATP-binding cassette domain-containing protein [Faecousia sp.]
MLETKNLVKIYRPKKGVPVTALNDVSLKFPDKGMVFLLGKSGSGKSTLLNVLGGLDRYDGGEILIKGKSSKTFRQQDFDSYRNTYVGFIFQEYNILDEFSVGANIALALQLQGIKPTDEQINAILREVDLEGYGNRKPNELSGGQKQRVAIARALVKSPKIIMADEPTGALDSVTGRQILSTLKKLSADKLVIVVSHDREFAEQYGDRIIELADGSVVRDVERGEEASALPAPEYREESISLPRDYHLTEADEKAICDYIQRMIDAGKAPKIDLAGGTAGFRPTDTERIVSSKDGYHLIKSKLPVKYAFKMGASALKHKKFRLVMTILLSCVAFLMFGLADTMASYDYVTTSVSSLSDPDSQIFYAAFEKESGYTTEWSDNLYYEYGGVTKEDFDLIREKTGLNAYPVYSQAGQWMSGIYLDMDIDDSIVIPETEEGQFLLGCGYYCTGFAGYVEGSDKLLKDLDAKLISGSLPAPGTQELAVSSHILETFTEFGYQDASGNAVTIRSAEDLLGKKLTLDGIEYTISGVVDTGIDYSRYASLKEELSENAEFTDTLLRMVILQELRYALNYSLSGLAIVSEGQIQRIYDTLSADRDFGRFFWMHREEGGQYWDFANGSYGTLMDPSKVVWLDGSARTELGDGEIVMAEDSLLAFLQRNDLYKESLDFRLQYESETPDYSAITGFDLYLDVYGRHDSQTLPVRIVGILPSEAEGADVLISDALMEQAIPGNGSPMICQTIAAMPDSTAAIRALVEFSDTDFTLSDGSVCRFNLMNPVCFELKMLDEVFEVLRDVFLWVGVVFVVFAVLLFSNFIGTSIAYKKREIGILRAIGSRSNDVWRIFFAESFIIAMVNFVISFLGTAVVCGIINSIIRNQVGLLLTVLTVGFRQGLLLFAVCLATAAAASFLPVRRIAAKRPIDAIRDR